MAFDKKHGTSVKTNGAYMAPLEGGGFDFTRRDSACHGSFRRHVLLQLYIGCVIGHNRSACRIRATDVSYQSVRKCTGLVAVNMSTKTALACPSRVVWLSLQS